MLKVLTFVTLILLTVTRTATAQTCAAYPNTLTNGTTADANQVMANFNSIMTCANTSLAPVSVPSFTGHVTMTGGTLTITNGASTSANEFLDLYPSDFSGTVPYLFMKPSTGGAWNIGLWNGSGIYGTLNLEAPTILLGGSVGVNTSTPTYQLSVNGTAGGTSAWTVTSDARLKTHISPIQGALARIERLRGVTFDWKSPGDRLVGKSLSLPVGQRQMGFIAQEVAVVAPEAVVAPTDATKETYGMRDGVLVALLVEGIKEQQAEIEQLRAEVAALRKAK